jgi:hypothetical protein
MRIGVFTDTPVEPKAGDARTTLRLVAAASVHGEVMVVPPPPLPPPVLVGELEDEQPAASAAASATSTAKFRLTMLPSCVRQQSKW